MTRRGAGQGKRGRVQVVAVGARRGHLCGRGDDDGGRRLNYRLMAMTERVVCRRERSNINDDHKQTRFHSLA